MPTMHYLPYTVGYFRADFSVADHREKQRASHASHTHQSPTTLTPPFLDAEKKGEGIPEGSTPATENLLPVHARAEQEEDTTEDDPLELRLLISEDRSMQDSGLTIPLCTFLMAVARRELSEAVERLRREGEEIARQYHLFDTSIAEARRFVYEQFYACNHRMRKVPLLRPSPPLRVQIHLKDLINTAGVMSKAVSEREGIHIHNKPSLYQNLKRLEDECTAYEIARLQKTQAPHGLTKQVHSIAYI